MADIAGLIKIVPWVLKGIEAVAGVVKNIKTKKAANADGKLTAADKKSVFKVSAEEALALVSSAKESSVFTKAG